MKLPTTDVQILIDKECQELLDFIDLTYIQSEEDNTQNKIVLVLDKDDYDATTINDNNKLSDELAKLNDLREKGILTQEEFDKAKNKLLNQ